MGDDVAIGRAAACPSLRSIPAGETRVGRAALGRERENTTFGVLFIGAAYAPVDEGQ